MKVMCEANLTYLTLEANRAWPTQGIGMVVVLASMAFAMPADVKLSPRQSSNFYLDCGTAQQTSTCRSRYRTYCDSGGEVHTMNYIECGLSCSCMDYRYVPCFHICYEILGDTYDPSKTYEYAQNSNGDILDIRPVSEDE
ncbi:hypothetical protein HD806DRAFT_537943 [Xylariaceae sp. AK1471]|nr:hypothetical protein HD806DRAFT_537943 [Xylariaceae sp. AK1471]